MALHVRFIYLFIAYSDIQVQGHRRWTQRSRARPRKEEELAIVLMPKDEGVVVPKSTNAPLGSVEA